MTLLQTAVQRLRLPLPVARRGARKLLELLHEHATATDFAALLQALPEMAELAPEPPGDGLWERISRRIRRLTHRPRTTARWLRSTGLHDDYVAFVSAFALDAEQRLGEQTSKRLIESVPGLQAMTGWPLTPYRAPKQSTEGRSLTS